MIPTKTLKFWGFEEHPFADHILRDDLLKLFVDREEELTDGEDALGHSRVVGVYGSLGVGKSSFLQKLRHVLKGAGHPVAYVLLTADSEETLYREILAELLVLHGAKQLPLKRGSGLKAKAEAERLRASVSESRGANFGGKLLGLLGGDLKKSKSTQVASHDEASARATIRTIFDALKTPLVVILDDFEKLKYESSGKVRDYFPILSRFVATLEESFNHKNVSFVVSMDNQVQSHMVKQRKEGGEFAFSLNSLVQLRNLQLDHLIDFIQVRLKIYGWRGTLADFLTVDAFLALAISSSSHPRRAVRVLAESLKIVADRKQHKKQIDVAAMRAAAEKAKCPLDEKDWTVLEYLRSHGESSAWDDGLRRVLGYQKSKRTDGYLTSVDRRLRRVSDRLRLSFEDAPSGGTTKKVLRFPAFLKDFG